jgi:serine-type D-Ala-D-Ala carboxypeptidase
MSEKLENLFSSKVDDLVHYNLNIPLFSACSIGFTDVDSFSFRHYGKTCLFPGSTTVDDDTVYDFASLTKPLVVSLAILSLLAKKALQLDEKITAYYPSVHQRLKEITIGQLLNHTSGFPAHRQYYRLLLGCPPQLRREKQLEMILREDLIAKPGTHYEYSDLGFILLGDLVERVTGKELVSYWSETFIIPLGLSQQLFFKPDQWCKRENLVCTGRCPWSRKILQGDVNDDNCRIIGGIAGHAGLFGTVNGLLSLCRKLIRLYCGMQPFPALNRQNLIEAIHYSGLGTHYFGFDSPTKTDSSCGSHFSKTTRGHLGFTGTSFWIDFEKKIAVAVLTNRILYGLNKRKFFQFRVELHNHLLSHYLQAI